MLENFTRRVLRSAVDDDVLDVGIVLVEDGENRLFDELALTVGRRDDRDTGPWLAVGQASTAGRG